MRRKAVSKRALSVSAPLKIFTCPFSVCGAG